MEQDFFLNLKEMVGIKLATSSFAYYLLETFSVFLRSELWLNILMFMQAVGLLITIVLLGIINFLIIKNNLVGAKLASIKVVLQKSGVPKSNEIAKRLERAKQRLAKKELEEDRLAVIEASQLLEKGLALLGYKDSLARVNIEAVSLWASVTVSEILSAYNLRMRIVHFPNEPISHEEAERAISIFERALKDLGVI